MVFLYDRILGTPEEVSKKFSEYFAKVTENLVKENLISLSDLKDAMETQRIFWGGIKDKFQEITEDDEAIGKLAWQVYNSNAKIEPNDEIKSLIYDGAKAPWGFTLMACVLYES